MMGEYFERIKTSIQEVWPAYPENEFLCFIAFLHSSSEDLIKEASLILDKPYGKNNILKTGPNYGYSYVQIYPGQSTSLHYHVERKEFFFVKEGRLTLQKGDKYINLKKNDFYYSSPNEKHSLANKEESLLEIIEIFSPVLLDDKVRLQDKYSRQLGEVTHHE